MSKVEYTQLQQVVYSQMDPQSDKGWMETKGGPASYPVDSSPSVSQCHSANVASQSSFPSTTSKYQNANPAIWQSVKTPVCSMDSGHSLGHMEFQDMKIMALHETSNNTANKALHKAGGDSTGEGAVPVRVDGSATGINKENENLAQTLDSRLKCAVRVRLEDRFNRIQSERTRDQQAQDFSNNLLTRLHHPSQLTEAQQACAILVKHEGSTNTGTPQFLYPGKSPSSSASSSHTKVSASDSYECSSPLQEESNLQEMSLPRGFSFSYQQKWESAKLSSDSQNKLVAKQIWNDDALRMQTINQGSPQGQVDYGMEQRLLSEIQKLEHNQTINAAMGEPAPSNMSIVPLKSKEKKNRLERDRRRKIRVYCDNLNVLVPFCKAGTDKATTLQWTVAFLRYIQKQHGDSVKEEFENKYCERQKEHLNN